VTRSKRSKQHQYKKCVVFVDSKPNSDVKLTTNNETLNSAKDVLTLGFLGLSLIAGAVTIYNSMTGDE
jgi:hypothetical protein